MCKSIMMSIRESVKVIVRCRPMSEREKSLKSASCVIFDSNINQISLLPSKPLNAPPKNFTFDGVYDENSTTETIYSEISFSLVEGVLEGYNGTVFAYGQTGCGKSFTMHGVSYPVSQRGIVPRAFEHIFDHIDSSIENGKYYIYVSYLEIYNEEIRDLLGENVKKKLELKENPERGIHVPDLSTHVVHSSKDCEKYMELGWRNRATGSTCMNDDSSRSHSIFTISIEMTKNDSKGEEHIRRGKLNLVDLAGSERQVKTQASGERLKEAAKINLSLSALGNVISALVDGKSTHIPYRDSKLTRILQDSLGGNTKTIMIACISPSDNNYDETLSTLRYGNRAKNIKNKPQINEDPKDAILREYQEEIIVLKELLNKQTNGNEETFDKIKESLLESEREDIRKEYNLEMEELRKRMDLELESKVRMQEEMMAMKNFYDEKLKALDSSSSSFQPESSAISSTLTNELQNAAIKKLKRLQGVLIDGGKRAGDQDLKERRLKIKRAAEKRLKVLGEALSTLDTDDGVLVQVYDDIQEELRVKNEALRRNKQKVKGLSLEINDLHREFETDRTDYLNTIRKQEQQIIYCEQILEKISCVIRKDCNYANLSKIKQESIWMDESHSWKIPELTLETTRLPPSGLFFETRSTSKTAPARLEGFDEEDNPTSSSSLLSSSSLAKKLARSEAENIVGNYFKTQRASTIMAQAQYYQQSTERNASVKRSYSPSLQQRDEVSGHRSYSLGYHKVQSPSYESMSKPSRLEVLPALDRSRSRKKAIIPDVSILKTLQTS